MRVNLTVSARNGYWSESLVCRQMQLAMKAFAKVKQGHAVQVKVVAATRASDNGSIKGHGEHDDKPGNKGFAYCVVTHGHPH